MADLSKHERKKLKKLDRASNQSEPSKKSIPKPIIFGSLGLLTVIIIGVVVANLPASSGNLNEFTQCLTASGVVLYGNEWCSYTTHEKQLFGDSFKFLDYRICDDIRPLCTQLGISVTPSFVYNDEILHGVQELRTLSAVTGCKLP